MFFCMFFIQKNKIKLAKELSDVVIYCKSVHFNSFEHSREKQACYEMSSFKESKAKNLAENSGNLVAVCKPASVCSSVSCTKGTKAFSHCF